MKNSRAIKEVTGWSDVIVDAIASDEEAAIYIAAGLVDKTVNGRAALVNPAIDGRAFNCRPEWLRDRLKDYERLCDWNNADLMCEGYPPRDEYGYPF